MITGVVRISYANIFEPRPNQSGALKYSASLLIPKSDTATLKAIEEAIEQAKKKGLEKNIFTVAKTKAANFKNPLRDGDSEAEIESKGEAYRGHMFLNASANTRPGIIDKHGVSLVDADQLYSGCYVRADIGFYPYNKEGGIGIGVGLNNIMLVKEGERLDGRQDAMSAFGKYMSEDSEEVSAEDLV